jgi:hypothetical protein
LLESFEAGTKTKWDGADVMQVRSSKVWCIADCKNEQKASEMEMEKVRERL